MAEASAPASSANLGAGFDTLAVALEMRCRVEAEPADHWSVSHIGSHCPPLGSDDAVLEGARLAAGADRPLRIVVENEIPIGRGLGSSSAAIAAGAMAAWRAHGEEHDLEHLFSLVAAVEGHPDNAGATVFGGLVLATASGRVHRLPWNPMLQLLLVIPDAMLATREARTVLPQSYPADVVVRSLGRVGSVVSGLLLGSGELLAEAGGDELHELPRREKAPYVEGTIRVAMTAGALHACWSGAGPSVLVVVDGDDRSVVAERLRNGLPEGMEVRRIGVATTGTV